VPRRGRPSHDRSGPSRRRSSGAQRSPAGRPPVEEASDGDWVVRQLTGAATDKTYRCPGCDQEIRPGTPHVVTWPAYARDSDLDPWDTDSAMDWRRHWHTACWRARSRRHS
jgi:hypothetical protein